MLTFKFANFLKIAPQRSHRAKSILHVDAIFRNIALHRDAQIGRRKLADASWRKLAAAQRILELEDDQFLQDRLHIIIFYRAQLILLSENCNFLQDHPYASKKFTIFGNIAPIYNHYITQFSTIFPLKNLPA